MLFEKSQEPDQQELLEPAAKENRLRAFIRRKSEPINDFKLRKKVSKDILELCNSLSLLEVSDAEQLQNQRNHFSG